MSENASVGGSSARWQAHRPLSEPVLGSVEQELGAQAAQEAQAQPDQRASGIARSGNGIDHSGSAWWSRLQSQVAQQGSQRPAQAALVALGVGAMLALLAGASGRRRRDRS